MRRIFIMMPLLAAMAGAQTLTEVGASAAGSAIGSAAGKKVSEGITNIFGKVDKATAKAAKPTEDNSKNAPMLEVGPGAPRQTGGGVGGGESVPPPPRPTHRASAPKPAPAADPIAEIVPPPPPPPPPPAMTASDLKKVTTGMTREDLLKFGAPASRITMSDDGHVFESFSYSDKDTWLGRVKLTDGTVSSVEMP
jgi:hypothetical protein